MNLSEYVNAIAKVSESPTPLEGSPHYLRLAENYATLLRQIQERSPELVNASIIYPDNAVSRRLFAAETGIKLPKTQRDTVRALTEFVGADRVAEYRRELDERAEAGRKAEEERKAEAERRRLGKTLDAFREGQFIAATDFLDLARLLGAEVNPRTAGAIKRVSRIDKDGNYFRLGQYPNTTLNGTFVNPLIRLLVNGTDEPQPVAEPEQSAAEVAAAESLFRPGGTLLPA